MLFNEFALIASRALKDYAGAGSVEITAIVPNRRGPVIRWTAPRLATEREQMRKPGGGPSVGAIPGPVILDLLARTLQARWRYGTPRCPKDWDDQLIRRHRRVFGRMSPSTGPGWYWLWSAGAEALVRAGLPPGFVTDDTKEKFGQARWDWHADKDSQAAEDIIEAVDILSAWICEDCGQPGKLRRGSWIRCQCDRCEEGRAAA
ncbi:hypothetical protein FV226_13210 [Methylobacterium sp. WL12]|uniref:hypothetical protein n=1 Tax=Methylobacterium sp. WL12 TaxID=2603890 RepID=UPI0011CAD627|nr:hypothetical protein [Methylobacterium sp. WL12]TXM72182.1 hypothetical protein FV226_13210 [Methylobacterium sp. WL12]